MSTRALTVVLTMVIATSVVGTGVAQEKEGSQASPEMQAMMAAWAKAGTPGPQHALLAKEEGTWDLTMKFWMPGQSEPQVSHGTSTIRMILGGRFLHEQVSGEGMGGTKFEGAGITGYDNSQRRYVSVWTDSDSTALMFSAGHCSDDLSSCTYYSQAYDPAAETIKVTKMVERAEGPNKRVAQFFATSPDGSEHKMLELTYTRRTGSE